MNPDPRQFRPPRRHRGAAKEDGIDFSDSYRNAPAWAVAFGSVVPNQSASVLAPLILLSDLAVGYCEVHGWT